MCQSEPLDVARVEFEDVCWPSVGGFTQQPRWMTLGVMQLNTDVRDGERFSLLRPVQEGG